MTHPENQPKEQPNDPMRDIASAACCCEEIAIGASATRPLTVAQLEELKSYSDKLAALIAGLLPPSIPAESLTVGTEPTLDDQQFAYTLLTLPPTLRGEEPRYIKAAKLIAARRDAVAQEPLFSQRQLPIVMAERDQLKADLTAARQETLAAQKALADALGRETRETGAWNTLANCADTLRARDFGTEFGAIDERVIAMAKALDEARIELRQANLRAETAEKEAAEYRRMLGNRRDQVFVDASPDAELPIRILQAYYENGWTVSIPPELGQLMREWQRERNVIIENAITTLMTARTPAKPHELNASAEGEKL